MPATTNYANRFNRLRRRGSPRGLCSGCGQRGLKRPIQASWHLPLLRECMYCGGVETSAAQPVQARWVREKAAIDA